MSDDSDRRGRLVSVLKRVAATVAVVAMLAWVLWGAWGDARQIDWSGLRLRPGLLVFSCVLLGLGFVWHGLVWVLMMRMLGYTLAVRPGLRASALSQLGNYIPGKVFIVLFRVQVAARYGVPGVPIAGSIALETLLRNLMATMLGALGLYRLGEGESWLWGLGALIVLSLVFAHPRVFNAIARWVLRKLGRPPLPRELTGPQVLALLGCYLVYWVFYIAGFFLAWRRSAAPSRSSRPSALGRPNSRWLRCSDRAASQPRRTWWLSSPGYGARWGRWRRSAWCC